MWQDWTLFTRTSEACQRSGDAAFCGAAALELQQSLALAGDTDQFVVRRFEWKQSRAGNRAVREVR